MCLEFCFRLFSSAPPVTALYDGRVIPGQGRGNFDRAPGVDPRLLYPAPVVNRVATERFRAPLAPVVVDRGVGRDRISQVPLTPLMVLRPNARDEAAARGGLHGGRVAVGRGRDGL
ncbi:MAG: hypothetical protein H0X29_06160 [Parachlamydiaceae bacterium]|nr:hypothetical protein [Parachlamydiaceae bacterium]